MRTIRGTNLIQRCQWDHLLEGILKGVCVWAAGLDPSIVSTDGLLCRFCIGCSLSLNYNGTKLCIIRDIFGPSYSFWLQVFGQIQSFVSNVAAIFAMSQRSHWHCKDCCNVAKIACNCMQLHAIACDRSNIAEIANLNVDDRLSKILKIQREREAGLKVCPKCFFTTTVNRFIIIIIFYFLKKEEMRSGTHFTQQTCFFLMHDEIGILRRYYGLVVTRWSYMIG